MAKRYSPFDIGALCNLVSWLPSVGSPIVEIEKKEGGFNKALLMKAESGRALLAKIPCRNIVPRQYGTASEVAVLKLGRCAGSCNANANSSSQKPLADPSGRGVNMEREQHEPGPIRVYRT